MSCVGPLIITYCFVQELQQKAQELRAEGELIAMCSHINIAKVFGACTTPPNFCLVLEYARGGALSSVLARTTLEPTVIVDFATQVCRACLLCVSLLTCPRSLKG